MEAGLCQRLNGFRARFADRGLPLPQVPRCFGCEFADDVGRNGRVIYEHRPGAHRREHPVVAQRDGREIVVVADAGQHRVLVVRGHRDFLTPLPIEVAEPTPAQAEILRGWGIATLGQLTALSKAEIGGRLDIPLGPNIFTLTARADRIERRHVLAQEHTIGILDLP